MAARLIATAAHTQGLTVTVGETFGAPRRGGTVHSHIRLHPAEEDPEILSPLIPLHRAHLLLGLEPLEALRAAQYLNPQSILLMNTHPHPTAPILAGISSYPPLSTIEGRLRPLCTSLISLDAHSLAIQAGDPRTSNTVMIGLLAGLNLTPITRRAFQKALTTIFPDPRIRTVNQTAFKLGIKHAATLNLSPSH